MSKKNKLAKIEKKKRDGQRRVQTSQFFVNGVLIPINAIPANLDEQAPNNSYSPPMYYEDLEFSCIDCGVEEVWTAEQQQWWYEVAKGAVQSTAIRCRACRKAHREANPDQGDS